jgi:hypothetical protein
VAVLESPALARKLISKPGPSPAHVGYRPEEEEGREEEEWRREEEEEGRREEQDGEGTVGRHTDIFPK